MQYWQYTQAAQRRRGVGIKGLGSAKWSGDKAKKMSRGKEVPRPSSVPHIPTGLRPRFSCLSLSHRSTELQTGQVGGGPNRLVAASAGFICRGASLQLALL